MNYQEFDTLPEFKAPIWKENGVENPDEIKWSGKQAPPNIGDKVTVTINGCGPAIVTKYFVESNWLGFRCRLLNPPEWYVKQNGRDTEGHVFGAEYTPME